MTDLQRILNAYEKGLEQLHDDVATGMGATREEQEHLDFLHQLLQGLLRSYASFQLSKAPSLDASTSVMYAASEDESAGRILNVPLRSLVDYGTLNSWHARYLNGNLGMKRTILVAGGPDAGKSTLLNALVQLISVDQRLVTVEEEADSLPATRTRSFTMRLPAKTGTGARETALHKGAGMQPTWLLVDGLLRDDGPPFFAALSEGIAGLASMESPDPEATLNDWASDSPETLDHLRDVAPLVVFMSRDQGGRPRVVRLLEASVEVGRVRLRERRPRDEE